MLSERLEHEIKIYIYKLVFNWFEGWHPASKQYVSSMDIVYEVASTGRNIKVNTLTDGNLKEINGGHR